MPRTESSARTILRLVTDPVSVSVSCAPPVDAFFFNFFKMVLMVALFLLSSDLVAESVLSCGTRSSDYPPARWPFHVGLFAMDLPNQEHYFCGGTLVGDRTVLTAAHCVIGYRTTQSTSKPLLTVHVGEYELYNPTRNNGTKYHVAAVVIHPEYNVKSLTNDVAVLQLVKRVEFNGVVQPACLWPANDTSLDDIPGTVATAVGWGRDVNEQFSNVLTERTHPVALKKECEKQFGASFLRSMGEDSIMCASEYLSMFVKWLTKIY